MPNDMKISWIGVGKLGHPMASQLVKAGLDVTVYDTVADNTRDFSKIASTLQDAARSGDVVISTIPNDAVLKAVALGETGLLSSMRKGAIYMDMSTVSAPASAEVAKAAGEAGIHYLRAPVSGSVAHAENGILTVLCSGNREAFDTCAPVFDPFSAHAYHVGTGEEARYLKLVINNLVGSTIALLAESLALGRKGGLDWKTMLDVISNSAVASPLVKYKAGPLAERNFDPAFTTTQMIKDIGLVVEAAEANDCQTPLAAITLDLLKEQAEAGMADEDFAAMVKLMEQKAGLDPIAS